MANCLKTSYLQMIVPMFIKKFNYANVHQVPKVEKIVVNCSIKDAAQNSKHLDAAVHYLTLITGQRPGKKQAKNAIASFKNRENQPLGIAVTLRGNVMYSFLERLITSGLHSTSEFQGVRPNSFDQDGNGNYRIGIREQILFPEISYDVLGEPRRIDVRISTTAQTDKEAHILLALMGMPFSEGAAPTNVAQEVEASPF